MISSETSRYCSECRNHTRHDCRGKVEDQEARYVLVDGEKRPALGNKERQHGLNFCKLYEFDLRMYPRVVAGVDPNKTLDNDQSTGVTPKQNDSPTPPQTRRKTKVRLKKSSPKNKTNATKIKINPDKIKLKFKAPSPVGDENDINDADLMMDSSSFDDLLVD